MCRKKTISDPEFLQPEMMLLWGQLVEEDGAARPHDVLNHGDVGQVAGDQGHHLFDADEIRERQLEILVARALAADETGGEGPDADHLEGVRRGALDSGMPAQTEVIVIGEGDEPRAFELSVASCLVDRHEKRIVLSEVVAAREAKPLLGEVSKALLFRHGFCNLSGYCNKEGRPEVWRRDTYPLSERQEQGRHATRFADPAYESTRKDYIISVG